MKRTMNRREFLKTGMSHVAGAIVLTACGGLFAKEVNASDVIKTILVDETMFITTVDFLKMNGAVPFEYKGKRSILLYNDGNIKAFENICTHKGGPNSLQGDKLVCQWHGATFDPLTGKALKGPAPKNSQLPEVALRIDGDKVYVSV